eukprot:Hpha_TRINITY_DN6012_c0_g1::TRINITY_DN6012_c0_g1_i1::g.63367::m.63367
MLPGSVSEQQLHSVFDIFDDGTGSLDANDVLLALRACGAGDVTLDAAVEIMASGSDGRVDREGFVGQALKKRREEAGMEEADASAIFAEWEKEGRMGRDT